jgi:hypothetical protein
MYHHPIYHNNNNNNNNNIKVYNKYNNKRMIQNIPNNNININKKTNL